MSTTYSQDTTSLQVGNSFPLSLLVPRISNVTVGNKKPLAVINNETGCSLSITLSGGRQFAIPAGAWTKPFVITQQDVLLSATVLNVLPNSPVNLFSITVYRPEEEVVEPVALGNSPIGISGSVATTSGNSLKNDGNNPPVSIIESTPADQTQSSMSINNDGSGFWQVLSANVLRKVLNIVRGNSGAGKAAFTIGDSGDTSITTLYGNVTNGAITNAVITNSTFDKITSDAGKLTSDGAGNLTANTLHTASLVASTTAAHFFIETLLSGATALGIAFTTWTGSATATPFSVGGQIGGAAAFVNNGGDVHAPSIGGVGTNAFEIIVNGHTIVFNTDGTISVSPHTFSGTMMMAGSAGGGNPGILNWFGTTDPGTAASDGDMWIPA